MTSSTSSNRNLFGGAIQSVFPSIMLDASDLRQVPDTQEVLLSPDSDITAILEVLECVSENGADRSLEEAIKFHFASLANDNNATTSNISKIYTLSTSTSTSITPSPILCYGIQEISKFGRKEDRGGGLDKVRIWLALWRLSPTKNVDLVLSFNEPLRVVEPPKEDEENREGTVKEISNQSENESEAREMFEKACESLEIKDWGLFAN